MVSIRDTVPPMLDTAHTAPGAEARLKVRSPVPSLATTCPVAGSTRMTPPYWSPPTQRLPPPLASPYDHCPTSTRWAPAPPIARIRNAATTFAAPTAWYDACGCRKLVDGRRCQ